MLHHPPLDKLLALRACLKSGLRGNMLPSQVVQWRWIVERTFGWLNRSRRLSKDFEALPETTETWIRIAMIHLMVRRLAARA